MTFLQQKLGKNYKWWYFVVYYIKTSTSTLRGNFFNILSELVKILAVIYIWYFSGSAIETFSYLLIGQIFKSLGEFYFYNSFSDTIISGKLTPKLLNPISLVASYWVGGIGKRIPYNLVETIAPVLAAIIFVLLTGQNIFLNINFGGLAIILILFIPLAFSINFLLGYTIGSLAFFIDDKRDSWGINNTANNFISVFRGTIIPLDKIPWQHFFTSLPFSFSLHHPMQIYLGKYSQAEIVQTFFGGILWCLGLWILARLVFKAGLKHNEAVGL